MYKIINCEKNFTLLIVLTLMISSFLFLQCTPAKSTFSSKSSIKASSVTSTTCTKEGNLLIDGKCRNGQAYCTSQGNKIFQKNQCYDPAGITCEEEQKGTWDDKLKKCTTDQNQCEEAGNIWKDARCIAQDEVDCTKQSGIWDPTSKRCIQNNERDCLSKNFSWDSEKKNCINPLTVACDEKKAEGFVWKDNTCQSPEELQCRSLKTDVRWFQNKCITAKDYEEKVQETRCAMLEKFWDGKECLDSLGEKDCLNKQGSWLTPEENHQKEGRCISQEEKKCTTLEGTVWDINSGSCACIDNTKILENNTCVLIEEKNCLPDKAWVKAGERRQTKDICLTKDQIKCYENPETWWEKNSCTCIDSSKKILDERCVALDEFDCNAKKDQGWQWHAPECKSPDRIACETDINFGSVLTWYQDSCMSNKKKSCLQQGKIWNSSNFNSCASVEQGACELDNKVWVGDSSTWPNPSETCVEQDKFNCLAENLSLQWTPNRATGKMECTCKALDQIYIEGQCISERAFDFSNPSFTSKLLCIETTPPNIATSLYNFDPTKISGKTGCTSTTTGTRTAVFKVIDQSNDATSSTGLSQYCAARHKTQTASYKFLHQADCNSTEWDQVSNMPFFLASPYQIGSLQAYCSYENISDASTPIKSVIKWGSGCFTPIAGWQKTTTFYAENAVKPGEVNSYLDQCIAKNASYDNCDANDIYDRGQCVYYLTEKNNCPAACENTVAVPAIPNLYEKVAISSTKNICVKKTTLDAALLGTTSTLRTVLTKCVTEFGSNCLDVMTFTVNASTLDSARRPLQKKYRTSFFLHDNDDDDAMAIWYGNSATFNTGVWDKSIASTANYIWHGAGNKWDTWYSNWGWSGTATLDDTHKNLGDINKYVCNSSNDAIGYSSVKVYDGFQYYDFGTIGWVSGYSPIAKSAADSSKYWWDDSTTLTYLKTNLTEILGAARTAP